MMIFKIVTITIYDNEWVWIIIWTTLNTVFIFEREKLLSIFVVVVVFSFVCMRILHNFFWGHNKKNSLKQVGNDVLFHLLFKSLETNIHTNYKSFMTMRVHRTHTRTILIFSISIFMYQFGNSIEFFPKKKERKISI